MEEWFKGPFFGFNFRLVYVEVTETSSTSMTFNWLVACIPSYDVVRQYESANSHDSFVQAFIRDVLGNDFDIIQMEEAQSRSVPERRTCDFGSYRVMAPSSIRLTKESCCNEGTNDHHNAFDRTREGTQIQLAWR